MARKSATRAFAGTPALGAIAPRGGCLGRRRRLPRAPRHISLGAEDAREQARDGQIGVQRFPMQAVARPKDLDLGKSGGRRPLQSLRKGGRERKRAAVGQLDNDAAGLRNRSAQQRRRAVQGCVRSLRVRWRRRFRRLSTQPRFRGVLKHASNSRTNPGGSSAMVPPRTIRVRMKSPSSLAWWMMTRRSGSEIK